MKREKNKLDEIEAELQADLKEFDRIILAITIFFGAIVVAPVIGLLIAAAYKWWVK